MNPNGDKHGYTIVFILFTVAILLAIALIFLAGTWWGKTLAACETTPVTTNTPTGIAGCEVFGEGTASHYGPGDGVAMNFCTWEVRHTSGCGIVTIQSVETGEVVQAPVVDFCDCYTGTAKQRIVDLQYGVVARLGLDLNRGLYPVIVWREGLVEPLMLPNTAMQGD